MGLFDTIFGGKKKETSTTEQSGDTKYGLTPEVLDYWKSISGMFDPSQWQGVGPDQYQTDAAGRAAGFVNSLYPAVGTAFGIGATGIDPRSISSFMNPYQDEVIRKGLDDMESGHAMERATTMGQAAKLGALSGTNPLVARNLLNQKQGDERSGFISNLRNQGFDKASNLAAQSAQTQLAGLGQMGNLVNQQAGINQGQFGMGTQFWNQGWQNAMMPYQIGQWGSGLLGQLSPYSGQQTHGTSFGNSTTTGSPSPFSIFGNLVGLGANLFSDERVKENVAVIGETFDGQPIYRYNYIGDPRTTIGLMAQDVEQTNPEAVGEVGGVKVVDYDKALSRAEPREEAMADGGSVGTPPSDPHAKFRAAFDVVSGMMAKARGGSVMQPYADGGAIPSWSTPLPIEMEAPKAPAIGSWDTTVTPASSGMDWKKLGEGVAKAGADSQPDLGGGRSPLADQQNALSRFLASTLRGAPTFPQGGVVREWGEQGPVFAENDDSPSGLTPPLSEPVERATLSEIVPTSARMSVEPATPVADKSPRGGWLGKFLPGLNEGHWVGDESTPTQRLGLALMSIRDPMWEGPLNGFARSIGEQQKQRLDRMRVEQAADQFAKGLALQKSTALGAIDGQPTLEAQRVARQALDRREEAPYRAAMLRKLQAETAEIERKEADPIGKFITERLAAISKPPAAPSGVDPNFRPQSMTGDDSGEAKLIPTQAVVGDGPVVGDSTALPGNKRIDTPLGEMPLDEARKLGGAMLTHPKYKALGEEIMRSIQRVEKVAASGNMSQSAMSEVNKKEVNASEGLSRLVEVGRMFDPKYQTWEESLKNRGLSFLDSVGFLRDKLTDEQRKGLSDFTKFRSTAVAALNDYVKEITGAAMSAGEAERIRKAIIDVEKDGPTEFKAKLDQGVRLTQLALIRHAYTRKSGKPWSESGITLDQMERLVEDRTRALRDEAKRVNPSASPDRVNDAVGRKLKEEFGI